MALRLLRVLAVATLRLRVDDRKITEAEWVIARKDASLSNRGRRGGRRHSHHLRRHVLSAARNAGAQLAAVRRQLAAAGDVFTGCGSGWPGSMRCPRLPDRDAFVCLPGD